MKALINNPKRTGIICFITLILTMIIDIVYQYQVYSIGLTNNTHLTSLLLKDFLLSKFAFLLIRQILFGRLFLILYLGIVLFKKSKNMKILNIIAIIQLVIFGFNELIQVFDTFNYYGNILSVWYICFYFISIAIMIYLMINIILKKKINYTLYSLIAGIMLMIVLVVNVFNRPTLLSNTIYNILESISYLTILIFIYSYGISINKRSVN